MARWFRSEDMAYVSIIVNEDAAHTCISDLGKLGMIQFTDLNPELTAFQRRYVAYIKRIDELERKLAFFGEEVRAVFRMMRATNVQQYQLLLFSFSPLHRTAQQLLPVLLGTCLF